jgi:P-loop Domain of unknown function (DUF2791)
MDAAAADPAWSRTEDRRMSSLFRDLIHIPERVQTNDFVLKLSEGVTEAAAAETIKNYVVTPQLARAFNEAFGFIRGSIDSGRSAACYLDGSFGSGKSHFMAVLDLLLAGNVKARGIPELADVINRYEPILNGKRFLMVPYHMIGARDVETAILGGYADHVRRLHPDAPVPGFYLGEKLFDDARSLQATMGDEAFFKKLNEGKENDGDGWGDFGSEWNAASFESTAAEAPEGEERQRLVGDLITTFFHSYADVAATRGEAFLDVDRGLVVISQHAQRLGYDAVVLFLDELILWLATRAGDVDFVSNEGSKLSKLVEAQRSERPIPIISFVARQRDLRELIGDHHAGALEVRFLDTLKHWEARFDKVKLEDRNLPMIVQKRLLVPINDTAKQEIDTEFERMMRQRQQVLDTLLGSDGERDLFRQVYPFSPALVQALIAASSVLQRERTALKLMLTLLVKKRGELRLGNLIPVGDLWDEIATGDQPFSEGMRIQFDNAKKLWNQKLQPLLEVLMERRLAAIARTAPAFSAVLRAYRRALFAGDAALSEGLIAWLGGQPNVAASVKRAAGVKGDLDAFGAMHFLAGLLTILRDSGRAGLVLVLDEAETLQRMRADTREKGLNALRQLLDEIDAGRYPGLYLVVTGTTAFFEGPQGVQRLPPLAQRLHTDFATEPLFDNPRAVQVRLPGFDLDALATVGRRVRDLFAEQARDSARINATVDDQYLVDLARGVAGRLGGRAGVAPRLYLRKLVAEVLDRVDQFVEFDPRRHYAPTVDEREMTGAERAAAGAADVDDVELSS